MTASLSALIPVSADTTDTGTCGANGDNVKWSYDSSTSTLTLSGAGATAGYYLSNEQPYYNCGAKTIIVEEGITSLGTHVFSDFPYLQSVSLPDSLTTIGYGSFSGNKFLEKITIPNKVTNLGNYSFARCSKLESITIPNSVTNIGDNAFENCTNLKEITIPNSVTSINNWTFASCTNLEKITIPDSVTYFGVNPFENCNPEILTIRCNSGSYVEWLYKTYPEHGDPKIEIIGKSNNPYVPTSKTTKPKTTKDENKKASIQASRKASRIAVKAKEAQKAMKQAKIIKLKVKSKSKKTINITWKKVKKATGYQVQISTNKKFKKLVYDKHTSKKALKIKKAKFKSGKKYYVRVRAYAAYTNIENKRVRVYSAWNKKLRKVKVK